MDVTEASPRQDPDDLLLTGWSAPATHPTTAELALVDRIDAVELERDKARALNAALRVEVRRQIATVAELARRNIETGEYAARERAHRIRLERENRGLRERLEVLQRANESGGVPESPVPGLQPAPGRSR
jgi:hypothetical protein